MSPTIFKDAVHRDLRGVWDRIPILATAASIHLFLTVRTLEKSTPNESVSLSSLALYLMSGEILMNHLDYDRDAEKAAKSHRR